MFTSADPPRSKLQQQHFTTVYRVTRGLNNITLALFEDSSDGLWRFRHAQNNNCKSPQTRGFKNNTVSSASHQHWATTKESPPTKQHRKWRTSHSTPTASNASTEGAWCDRKMESPAIYGLSLVCGAVFHSCKLEEHRLLCPTRDCLV
ncbi:hypothetical protein WMY93_016536 [Mugilogobius chulae]|uniref:TRAF-type domain-containing protein n=1 Tax=Mugilogobius chulae TaxID=88201 RepID=A0AAW0NPZ3_9GOBI